MVKIQFDDGSKEMEIDHKNGSRTFIDGTFDDIKLNYEGSFVQRMEEECRKLKEENEKIDAIKKYIKQNEKKYGSLLDSEKAILKIIDGE